MGMVIVYTVCKDEKEAETISKKLVSSKLAACTNSFSVRSCWEGFQNQKETAMIIKTKEELVPDVFEAVKKLHSYNTPALFVIPVSFVDDKYLDWLMNSTEQKL